MSDKLGGVPLNGCGKAWDYFVAKLSPQGKLLWAWQATCTSDGNNTLGGMVLAASGDVMLAGSYSGTMVIGQKLKPPRGDYDIFVVQLDSTGKPRWATTAGGAGMDSAEGLAMDSKGDIYIAGSYHKSATFGSKVLTATNQENEAYVAKLSGAGAFLWASSTASKKYNGAGARAIAVDGQGNSYITGYYANSVSFGSTTHTSRGHNDIFVAKLDASGSFTWAATAGGTSALWSMSDSGQAITVGSSGEITIAGYYLLQAKFGSVTLQKPAYGSSGYNAAFVARLSPKGAIRWAVSAGGYGSTYASNLATDSRGWSALIGSCVDGVQFGKVSADCGKSGNCTWPKWIRTASTEMEDCWLVGGGPVTPFHGHLQQEQELHLGYQLQPGK